MKLAYPKLSTNLENVTLATMIDDGELESARLYDEIAINCNVAALQLIDTVIEDVQFTGAHLSRIVARDVIFKRADLASASLDNGMLVRVEFINCRMTGIDFSWSNIHDVTFKDCQLDRVDFTKAHLRRVAFIDCSLESADFTSASLTDIER